MLGLGGSIVARRLFSGTVMILRMSHSFKGPDSGSCRGSRVNPKTSTIRGPGP